MNQGGWTLSWQQFYTEVAAVWALTALSYLGTCVGDGLAKIGCLYRDPNPITGSFWWTLGRLLEHTFRGLIRTAGACSGSGSTLSTAVCEMGLFCVENDYSPRWWTWAVYSQLWVTLVTKSIPFWLKRVKVCRGSFSQLGTESVSHISGD